MTTPMLRLDAVSKRFTRLPNLGERIAGWLGAGDGSQTVHAVDDVSLEIAPRETLALVGESGCGKSTLGRLAAGIYTPDHGSVRLRGQPVMATTGRPRKITTKVQTIFQDPFASLNPRMRIADILAEGPLAHGLVKRGDADGYVARWLTQVGLDPGFAGRYPHQFSGGQRQRIAIARALAMQPDLLVCDEPVASLDVSIQAQILNLLVELRRELGLTCLFISHDLGVVRHVSDRVAIMYLGRVVELGPTAEILARPRHPYTQALLASVPRLRRSAAEAESFRPIRGEIPSPLAPPPGCHFNPRCPMAIERCRREAPVLTAAPDGRAVSCHLAPTG
ncbi:MAG: ATP-binding cassette domain-containing protein [Alphaproteobacteria bacterium]|nr:ATP-binding cassette domain-containing protein [Alphaproteobacteria bacterium]